MNQAIKAVTLAAGKSKRMKSCHSKMVHQILGKEIINILLDAFVESGISEEDLIIITGKDNQAIKKVINKKVSFVIQEEQLGTAHALLSAKNQLMNFQGNLIVTVGDNPHISGSDIKKLIDHHQAEKSHCTLLTAVFPKEPPPYGRVIRDKDHRVVGVVEEIDASPDQLQIKEVNASVYIFNCKSVFPLLSEINNHNQKMEYYLTDIVGILVEKKLKISSVIAENYWTSIGINNRWDLQQAQKRLNERNQKRMALERGVTILQPETVTIEFGVEIGRDTIIYPSTYIASGTSIGKNCQIGPFVYLKNVTIQDSSNISFKKQLE